MAWQAGDYLFVEGFGYKGVDGYYFYFEDSETGDEYFIKDGTSKEFYIQRHPIYLPYCEDEHFYIKRVFKIPGAIKIVKALYRTIDETLDSGWTSLLDEEADSAQSESGFVYNDLMIWEQMLGGQLLYTGLENYKNWRIE